MSRMIFLSRFSQPFSTGTANPARSRGIDFPTWFLHGFFLLYSFLCVFLFRERLLFDTAHFLLNFVQREDFFIAHGRYSDYFAQLLPVLLAKLEVPLTWIAMSYSLSFALVFYFVAVLLHHVLGRRDLALGVVVCVLATSVHCFVLPLSQTGNGGAFALLLLGLLQHHARGWRKLLCGLGACIATLILFCFHPLLIPVFLFVVVYTVLSRTLASKTAAGFALAGAAVIVLQKVFVVNPYEQDVVGRMSLSIFVENLGMNGAYLLRAHPLMLLGFGLLLFRAVSQARLRASSLLAAAAALGVMAVIFTTYSAANTWIYLWHILLPVYIVLFLALFDLRAVPMGPVMARIQIGLLVGVGILHAVYGGVSDVQYARERQGLLTWVMAEASANDQQLVIIDDAIMKSDPRLGVMDKKVTDETLLLSGYGNTYATTVLIAARYSENHQIFSFHNNPAYFTLPKRLSPSDFSPLVPKVVQELQQKL